MIGGWLIERASWHWVFFINVPLAAALIVISLRHIPESRAPSAEGVDWRGALAATVSLAGLVYGFIESATLGWSHPLILGSLIVGFGCMALFIFIERRVIGPMVPLWLFNSRSFTGANLLTLLLYAALGIFFFLFPLNLIQIQGYSATATGAASVPMIVLLFFFFLSRWSGGLVAHYGPRLPLIAGPLIVAAGFILFAVPSVGSGYWATFFLAFVVLGLGMAVSVAPLTTVVMNSLPSDRAGTASGINNAVARVAGVLAVAILGNVMVQAFGYRLQNSLRELSLIPSVLHDMQLNLVKLGGLDVPPGLDANAAAMVRNDITQAFVFGFRLIMVMCAGLAMASAGVALRMLPSSDTK